MTGLQLGCDGARFTIGRDHLFVDEPCANPEQHTSRIGSAVHEFTGGDRCAPERVNLGRQFSRHVASQWIRSGLCGIRLIAAFV